MDQSLTLQCNAIIGSNIFSGVDIIWSDSNGELNRTTDVTSYMMGSDSVYTDSYTISQLSTTDEGRMIQCEVVINISPPVMASDSITLDVTGEYLVLCLYLSIHYCSTHSSHSYSHHITNWSHTR